MGKKSFRSQKQTECGQRGTAETKKEQRQKCRRRDEDGTAVSWSIVSKAAERSNKDNKEM